MSDYIKREDAIDWIKSEREENSAYGEAEGLKIAEQLVKGMPSADVVEVVRCKDCIHYDEHTRWQCDKFGQSVNADDYCSYGERKEQENE